MWRTDLETGIRMEETTRYLVCWRVESVFLFVCFFYSPYKLKHYSESWWGRKPSCWFPGCSQHWVNCFFIYWSLWSWTGFKLFWLSSRTLSSFCPFSHLHLHVAQGSSLHSLPWKLIQEKKPFASWWLLETGPHDKLALKPASLALTHVKPVSFGEGL